MTRAEWAKRYEVTLDHLKPQVKSGTHESINLVTACARCNCGRQDRPWWTFATPGAVDRIKLLRRRVLNIALAAAIIRGEVPRCEVQLPKVRDRNV